MSHHRRARGLVLGKFLPLHAGHMHLIRTAASFCDELTVLVCSIEREPIPGSLRASWMREVAPQLGPNITVVHVAEEVPQAPEDHPRFWEIWANLVWRHAGRVDIVFSSERYGDELARELGARHHPVDLVRHTFPVSGTAVREDAFQMWAHLPAPVRAYYAARVALVGPESTGKTTLAARLAAAFGTVWVPEYGREHTAAIAARTGVSEADPRFTNHFSRADITTIARVQAMREDAAARVAARLLVCDTELVTTRIWSEIFFGDCPVPVVQASESRAYDLYLLLDTDIPWVDDGTRGMPDRRRWHFEQIRTRLEALGRPYEVISGSFGERLDRAAAAIQRRWPALQRIDVAPESGVADGSSTGRAVAAVRVPAAR